MGLEMLVPRVQDERVSQRIDDGLRNVVEELHPNVIRVKWSFGEDWSGDPAIFFRILLSDAASRRDDLAEFTGDIDARISDKLHLAELDHLPYFNFRSDSEQKRLKDPEWD